MAAEGVFAAETPDMPAARQWGRGRMAAEGARRWLARGEARGVNGAAAGWPRKAAWAEAAAQRRRRSVNGAAAGWPRKAA